ncbi:hypothetical protein FQN57_004558 [Myotisia sp. PD_48]|nr:hypothetical protein FQN57_004558 [Myotisia sp. PD_48]
MTVHTSLPVLNLAGPAAALLALAKDLSTTYPQYSVSEAVSQIEQNTAAIDLVLETVGLTKAEQARAIAKLVFNEACIDPGHPKYNEAKEINWSTSCCLPAACYVKPSNTSEVAIVLKIVTLTGSKFAVRSAGNNPNPTFGSVDSSGIVIDVSGMKTLQLSDDQKVLHVGTGNKIGEVQKYMDDYEVGVVTGVNNRVGLSGAAVGGGFPVVSGVTGLVCDNIKNYEVVLSDSRIVNANLEENADLFQVLKGGGNNFGILTRLDLHTIPVHHIWYHFFDVDLDLSHEFLTSLVKVQENLEKDPKGSFIAIASGNVWHVTLHYEGKSDVVPEVFQPLMHLRNVSTFFHIPPTNGTVYSYNECMTPKQPHIGRQPCAVTTRLDAQLYIDIFEHWKKVFPKAPGTGLDLCIKPFTSHSARLSTKNGPNILNNEPVAQSWWSVLAQWDNEKDREDVHNILESIVDYMNNQALATDNLLSYRFMNDSGHMQNVIGSYGEKSVAKMKAASRKYDVDQVFQKLQNGGWSVSKA